MHKRIGNDYNTVLHGKLCQKRVAVAVFREAFVNYGPIISVKAIFHTFPNFSEENS